MNLHCIDDLLKEDLENIIDRARDWALMHGISMRSKERFNKDQVEVAPFSLLPSSFPKNEFEKAREIQTVLNELMHKVAHDYNFLKENLIRSTEVDDFTAKLFHIYDTVYAEGFGQSISIGLLRSDYMLHVDNKIKQVELNTIASSFGSLATTVTEYHRYILTELGHSDKLKNIPENNALSGLSTALVDGWNLYNNKDAIMLFVVEDVTYNICDQRFLEFEIRRINPQIKIIRRSFTDLVSQARLGSDKELIVENVIVSVVYYRSGYEPSAYSTEHEWSIRLLLERSRAIKCPSIQYHLAGTKKVQQALAQSGALDKFLKEPKLVAKVQEIFTGLYSLDFDEQSEKAIAKALKEPKKFVLKPQREGGGNNVYDDNIRIQLDAMKDSKERIAWILMDRIHPPLQRNYLIRADSNCELKDVVSELGIYGVIIGDQNEIKVNRQVGHILRTKPSTANEGGIATGVGALDSPYLIT